MWHEKRENIILPGQTTCPPKKLQGAIIENMILPPHLGNNDMDFLGGSSRKRKSTPNDPPGATSEYCFPWESTPQPQQISSPLGINGRGYTHGSCLNQTKSVEPVTVRHQCGNDQFHYQNDFPGTWPTRNGNFHRTGIEHSINVSLNVPPPPFKGSFPLNKMPVGEDLTVPNRQPQARDMFGQTDARRSLPFMKSYNAHTRNAQFGPASQDLVSFGIKNHVVTDKMPLEMCNTSSECLRPVDMLHQSFLQPNRFPDHLDGRTCSQDANEFKISSELKRSGHYSNNAEIVNLPTVGTASLGASVCNEQNENHRSLQNEVQFGSVPSDFRLGDTSESKGQGHGDCDIKIKEKIEASDTENLKYSLTEKFSSENRGSPASIVGHGGKNDPSHGSLKLGEKSNFSSGKAASTTAEILWEGSLQLNSSITVSAVAFFKSGEKLLDVNWSEFVEVKGKVRLEAFEKYIQDLPRSRNRGLMVISLCWKEGSSETGLTGMKEVAKGYRKGDRVGFAQLSQGIDLYICPRSDAIITILAKYGFFKGMAAVEDNQDSLIGCVVWRRNRIFSNSVAKKLDSKNNFLSEQPLDYPSDSSTQLVKEKKLSPMQPNKESIPHAPVTSSPPLESAEKNGTGNNNIESSEVEVEVGNSSSGANSLSTTSVPNDSSSASVGQQTSPYSYLPSLQVFHGHSLEVEASRTCCSGAEQPKMSLELQKPVIPLPSDVMKQTMPDDDDLPEFDFRTACGISLAPISKPLDAASLDKRLPAEEIRNMDGSVPPTIPFVQAVSISNQRLDSLSLPRLPSAANQGMPQLKNICERESQIPAFHKLEEKNSVQSKATPMAFSGTAFASPKNPFDEMPRKKNLFDDDDDDMPEWRPPEPHKQSLAETSRPSTSCPSELQNSTSQNLPPGPLRPLLPSPSPAATNPAFPPAFQRPMPITVRMPQPIPLQRGPSYPMGFNSSPVVRPQSRSFDVKLPFRPADRRGWRP